jgi:haloalkane dehalogenase
MNNIPAWVNRELYPFNTKTISIDGQHMSYVEEGQGETILFVHGTPSWSFEWRGLIKALSPTHRCIAPDHIGFGLSAKPKDYNYTSQQHAANLDAFITALGLTHIILVVHDFGGPIGLNYAVNNADNIKRLIILNTWAWNSTRMPGYEKSAKILKSPLVPILYKYLNFSAKYAIPMSFGNNKLLTKDVHRMYTAPFCNAAKRMGTLGFVKSLLNEKDWFEGIWQKIDVICHKPALFVWGMADAFLTEPYLDKFEEKFTNKRTVRLPGVGHFPQEEYGELEIEIKKELGL